MRLNLTLQLNMLYVDKKILISLKWSRMYAIIKCSLRSMTIYDVVAVQKDN
jgi:hypothetical protein